MKERYVITALDKLTGKRETISLPYVQDKAEKLLKKTKQVRKRCRDGHCFINLRLRLYQPESPNPRFTPPLKLREKKSKNCISVC